MAAAGTELKKLADVAEPLFQRLDDSQKQRLRIVVQMMGARLAARAEGLHGFDAGYR